MMTQKTFDEKTQKGIDSKKFASLGQGSKEGRGE